MCFLINFSHSTLSLLDQIKRAKPNLNVLKEYKRREAEFLSRHDDLEKVVALRDAQKKKYEDLRKQRLEEFMAGFSTISLKLKEMYQVNCAVIVDNPNTDRIGL